MCSVLGVGRTSYYDWLRSEPSRRDLENQWLAGKIREIFLKHYCNYGARRIRKHLQNEGIEISRRRVRKLMKQQGLHCKTKRKFTVTTNSAHKQPIAPNLLERDFTALKPNQKYVGDITYIWTKEGWLYLAIVMDLFSRKIVGWSIQDTMRAELVNDALLMAIWKRKPGKGLIWHTDRGIQYASESHRNILKEHGIRQSMSRKGNCWDNAVAESFFHTLKTELTYHFNFETREEAKQEMFKYIEVYYNQNRIHSANDYLTPNQAETLANAL